MRKIEFIIGEGLLFVIVYKLLTTKHRTHLLQSTELICFTLHQYCPFNQSRDFCISNELQSRDE